VGADSYKAQTRKGPGSEIHKFSSPPKADFSCFETFFNLFANIRKQRIVQSNMRQ